MRVSQILIKSGWSRKRVKTQAQKGRGFGFICDRRSYDAAFAGSSVGRAHAGWRGLR